MTQETKADEQMELGEVPAAKLDGPRMIARVNAAAIKMVYPFMATHDVRYYLCGVNLRPLEDGGVMIVATNGHRYIVVRDPHGYAEQELIVSISKDSLKHMSSNKHSIDVMSGGSTMVSGPVAEQLFIQPGNSIVEAQYPRIERFASTIGYKEGISGAVNPAYLNDALVIAKNFGGSIRFFTRDNDSPLTFVLGGIGDLECFGGIMKMRDSFEQLPAWFPAPGEVTNLGEV